MGLFGFEMFEVLFTLTFLIILAVFIAVAVKGISTWNKNNNSPKLTVPATVVAKRENVSHHRHGGGVNNMHHYSTTHHYYVTFEFESKDRIELSVDGNDFGLIVEGDSGNLTFQGTRFLGFERTW